VPFTFFSAQHASVYIQNCSSFIYSHLNMYSDYIYISLDWQRHLQGELQQHDPWQLARRRMLQRVWLVRQCFSLLRQYQALRWHHGTFTQASLRLSAFPEPLQCMLDKVENYIRRTQIAEWPVRLLSQVKPSEQPLSLYHTRPMRSALIPVGGNIQCWDS
jgi:hypothetical protein